MEDKLSAWACLASNYIGECFDLAKPFIDADYSGLDPKVRFVVAQVFIDCHLSSESVLLLIGSGKEWDADVVCRSVMEGSVKFTYMLSGEVDSLKDRVEEYWDLLPELTRIKHSENAKRLLSMLPNPMDLQWTPIRHLVAADEEYEEFRSRYSRSYRQGVEERWSFNGILQYFAKSNRPGLSDLGGLAHFYSMSSHLAHKDAVGVGMVWERYTRDPAQLSAVKSAHAARIVSDVCAYSGLRLLMLLRVCHQKGNEIEGINKKYSALFEDLGAAYSAFNESEYGGRI